ncbi:XdhC family protein [Acetobacterium bakii]|uniref:XdhC family protein n=1 Tax=Acetobacterium bakii TaxID=52689 RepID=UPI0011DF963F|nr:XdhC/CoxI family protein [Acetobacterium bakii]
MSGLYEKISESNSSYKNIIATVVEGENFGEKAFISKGRIIFESKVDGIFGNNLISISKETKTGMLCIGGNRIFCEILGTEKKLVICGGGHVAIPIIKIGLMADYHVTVIEDRFSFANNAERAGANEVICDPFDQGLEKIKGDKNTSFVIVTRGHRYDQICLEKIIEKTNAYIGMIGSKLRVKKVLDQLEEKGMDAKYLEKVHTPIGLKINAETPVEIAVSIMAELIQVKNQKKESCGYSKELIKAINNSEDNQQKKVLTTIISRKGSAPREVGTKMLIFQDGRTVETLGGGCAEAEIKRSAFSMISENTGKSELISVDMTGVDAEEDGMVCGGLIEVFMEIIE